MEKLKIKLLKNWSVKAGFNLHVKSLVKKLIISTYGKFYSNWLVNKLKERVCGEKIKM